MSPSGTLKPALEAGFSEAADGTRTHDLLHGNRLGKPHKRLVLRFSPESDYRGLPGIRSLLVPQWSPASAEAAVGPMTLLPDGRHPVPGPRAAWEDEDVACSPPLATTLRPYSVAPMNRIS